MVKIKDKVNVEMLLQEKHEKSFKISYLMLKAQILKVIFSTFFKKEKEVYEFYPEILFKNTIPKYKYDLIVDKIFFKIVMSC